MTRLTREEVIHVLTLYVADKVDDWRAWSEGYDNDAHLAELNDLLAPSGWRLRDPVHGKLICNLTDERHPFGEFITRGEYEDYGPILERVDDGGGAL